jgi:polyribonucleotide nucleotidyltransferase
LVAGEDDGGAVMGKKIVSIALDELVHEEAKKRAKQQKKSLSKLVSEVLAEHLRKEREKEERQRIVELEEKDKAEKLSKEFMRRLLYDTEFRQEEWTPAY